MKNDANKSRFGEMLKAKLKAFFSRNIWLKIISLVFAMLLWGYVLITENPERVKVVSDVHVNIQGAADLATRRLTIRGDIESLLNDVSVRVETQLASYADLSADDITATVNLSRINAEGTQYLTLSATSSIGQVLSISPSRIEVEVDSLVIRRVPVEVRKTGTLPEGYWAGDISLDRTYVEIEGAEADITGIVKATGSIDLTGLTESVNQSMMLTLLDEAGAEVGDPALFGSIPTVVARMEVLAGKTVPIDIEGAIVGEETIPGNFELTGYSTMGDSSTAYIVGDAETIAGIDSLALTEVDVSGMTEGVRGQFAVIVPEGVRVIGDSSVNLEITIQEKTATAAFAELPIEIVGIGKDLKATLPEEDAVAEIAFTGRVSLLEGITRGDVRIYADVTGLAAGAHQVKLALELDGEAVPQELQYQFITPDTVQITIE